MLCLVNVQRTKRGRPPLTEDSRLQAAAQTHAEDMGRRDFYRHRNPDGVEPDGRIRATGFSGRSTGENIHWGVGINASPARIVDGWMASPGHRENILRTNFSRVGTGIGYDAPDALVRERAGVYVQNFGG